MMTVVFTTFVFGGATPCLLDRMNVATGVKPEEEEAKAAEGTIFKTIEEILVDPEIETHEKAAYKSLNDKGFTA